MFNVLGKILAVLLLLAVINSTYFFLGVSKVSYVEWIVFNACAPSSIVYLIGFLLFLITKNRTVLHTAILPMFFFGGLGLFVFPWTGYNIIAQISHIIMVLNILWLTSTTIRLGDYRPAAIGMLIGIAVFSFFIYFQQSYVASHPKDFERILGIKGPVLE